ncbi:MAG: DNA integrity scanning protein DisA nucleotide-binding domain protein [Archaeoglobus sp.]|nr:DNA integrity scanning protein DisA nucleotide-binding domain protein [Archaeoglobus sp.]
MLDLLLKNAAEIAKAMNEDQIFVISNSYVDLESINGVKIYNIPKKYSAYIESVVFSLEKEYDLEKILGAEFIERMIVGHHTFEYVSSLAYLKNIPISDNLIILVNLESYQGILILSPKKSSFYKAIMECGERVDPETVRAILNIAVSLATKGREGKSIGTAFVVGDVREVMKRSRQLVINPFEGHSVEMRNIKDPYIWETIREFAQLDGVFVVDENGTVIAAGRYLDVSASDLKIKPGLGARHMACAAITQETEAIAIVVSESGGDITIFKDGKEILRLSSILLT